MSTRLKAVEIEFHEGQSTIWVHGPEGATILRIKCTGKIVVQKDCENVCAHSDIEVQGDIHICVPARKQKLDQSKSKK